MKYTRENPSPRYLELIAIYQHMHVAGDPTYNKPAHEMFNGGALLGNIPYIKKSIQKTGARSILDYGCGKGVLYGMKDLRITHTSTIPSIQEYWGVDRIHLYDPAYAPYSTLPTETFDGVICTDVLEHCPEEDIPWILEGLFTYANRFVYANVASYPAQKKLPNGENAHCTIQPPQWWQERILEAAQSKPDVTYNIWIEYPENGSLMNQEFTGRMVA